jgi:hypothetical protein
MTVLNWASNKEEAMDNNWLPKEHEGIHRRTFLAMMGVDGTPLPV